MKKYKFLLTIIYAFIIITASAAEKKTPMPVLYISFGAMPFTADADGHGLIGFGGQTGAGFYIKRYTVIFDTALLYETAAEHDSPSHNRASFSLCQNVSFQAELLKYLGLSARLGLGWQRMSVQYDSDNITNTDYFIFGSRIMTDFIPPIKYLSLGIMSDLDFFFAAKDFRLHFDTLARIDAAAYFDFLHIYTDIGFAYEPLTKHASSAPYFCWETGVYVRLKLKQKKISQKVVPVVVAEKKTEMQTPQEKQQKQQENFVELYETIFDKKTPGDTIELQYIYFNPKQNDLGPQGLARINALAEVLAKNNYVFAIGCYSESLGNPDEEIILSKQRSQKIKNLLIARGVSEQNIKIKTNPIVYPDNTPNIDKKIEIKILK